MRRKKSPPSRHNGDVGGPASGLEEAGQDVAEAEVAEGVDAPGLSETEQHHRAASAQHAEAHEIAQIHAVANAAAHKQAGRIRGEEQSVENAKVEPAVGLIERSYRSRMSQRRSNESKGHAP